MTVIKCSDAGLRFERGQRRARMRSAIGRSLRLSRQKDDSQANTIWALRHIDFALPKGACLGICGANGSGKTSLLRLLCGVYLADEGKVSVSGDVVSLLSLGAGMSPALSGRDNVYLTAAVRSIGRRTVDSFYQEICEFAELDQETMDTPIRHFSAGMRARLSFAISAVMTPDILLIDEIFSVGDTAFRKKSGKRLSEIIERARCVVLTSHSAQTLREHCDHFMWLERGEIRDFGNEGVLDGYLQFQAKKV